MQTLLDGTKSALMPMNGRVCWAMTLSPWVFRRRFRAAQKRPDYTERARREQGERAKSKVGRLGKVEHLLASATRRELVAPDDVAVGIDFLAQQAQLLVCGRQCRRDRLADAKFEAGGVAHL